MLDKNIGVLGFCYSLANKTFKLTGKCSSGWRMAKNIHFRRMAKNIHFQGREMSYIEKGKGM